MRDTEEKPVFKSQRSRKRWLWALPLLLPALFAGFLWWQGESLLDEFSAGDKQRFVDSARESLGTEPRKKLPGLRQAQTFLLIGADRRAGSGERWGRSDTIVVARIYPREKIVSLLSIPRDTRVSIPGEGVGKINEAYSLGGPGKLVATVRDFVGVRIDHFLQIDFNGFAEIIDEVGGVYLPIDQRYFHSNEGLPPEEQYSEIDLEPGYQKLGAEDALSFVRFRHGDTDFLRAARQQLFLREIARQVSSQAQGDIGDIYSLARAIARASASDISSKREILDLARTLSSIPPSRVTRITMLGESVMISGVFYLEVDPSVKSETLSLWNDPQQYLNAQKKTAPGKIMGSEVLALGALAKQSLRALREPRASRAPLSRVSDWHRELLRITSPFPLLEESILSARTRRISAEEVITPTTLWSNPYDIQSSLLQTCSPTSLPAGYSWSGSREYTIDNYPAISLVASRSSGYSLLWNWSSWRGAPILQKPDDALEISGKRYSLYWESGALRMIAWREGADVAWITNTLGNEIDPDTMISLARSCL